LNIHKAVGVDKISTKFIKASLGGMVVLSGIGSCSKLGGYLSYQDTFVWSKITLLWSDSKNWGGLYPPILPPMAVLFTKLIDKSITSHTLLDTWKNTVVVPVQKSNQSSLLIFVQSLFYLFSLKF